MTRSLTEPGTPVSALRIPVERIVTVPADAGLRPDPGHRRRRRPHPAAGARRGRGSGIGRRRTWCARSGGRDVLARDLARPVPELAPDATVAHAVEQLRDRRATIAVVRDAEGGLTGLVSLDDLLARLLHPPTTPGAAAQGL
ncbi:Integral membrane protein OS=Streptomyces sp. ACT-1 OX=1609288 GN=SACT1_6830 PE=4 SV=1 [Streptomyces griseus subsp. griseus]